MAAVAPVGVRELKSRGTFEAPNGWRGTERTRFVSRQLHDLGEIDADASAVIACPDVIGGPDPIDVVIEGTLLGVMGDHGTESWLGDCVVTPL